MMVNASAVQKVDLSGWRVVTGGARGIGKEIVMLFLKEGASVYYMDIMEGDSLSEYRKIAQEAGAGGTVTFKKTDVSNETEVNTRVKEIISESDGIDVLVNNAGHNVNAPMPAMKLDDYDSVAAIARGRLVYQDGIRIEKISTDRKSVV